MAILFQASRPPIDFLVACCICPADTDRGAAWSCRNRYMKSPFYFSPSFEFSVKSARRPVLLLSMNGGLYLYNRQQAKPDYFEGADYTPGGSIVGCGLAFEFRGAGNGGHPEQRFRDQQTRMLLDPLEQRLLKPSKQDFWRANAPESGQVPHP